MIYVCVLLVTVWYTLNCLIELDSCCTHATHIHMVMLVFEYENLICEKPHGVNELGKSSWLVSEIWMMNWIYMNIIWWGECVDNQRRCMIVVDDNLSLKTIHMCEKELVISFGKIFCCWKIVSLEGWVPCQNSTSLKWPGVSPNGVSS